MKPFKLEPGIISEGYDRKTCWVHARPAVIPGEPLKGLVTTQKLRITGDDVFYEMNDFRSRDGGHTWQGPFAQNEALGRKLLADGIEELMCDCTPMWHAASGVVLATGLNGLYKADKQLRYPERRRTMYAVYDPCTETWTSAKKLRFPDGISPLIEGAGCTQRFDLPNGNLLLPTYFRHPERENKEASVLFSSTVMRCRFDGETLEYIEHGSELTLPSGRGFVEPSLAHCGGRYYLTLRNNDAAYVATSDDGLHFSTPIPWLFDDGAELGSYNTQQHWITSGDHLYLVYTRRGANNDHIMRHRAPLFIAQVQTEGPICIRRDSERIAIPEHGAALGNFGVTKVSETESWIVASEWMQTKLPDPSDYTLCEARGSNNRIFRIKVLFDT